jgi:hypothetical protein
VKSLIQAKSSIFIEGISLVMDMIIDYNLNSDSDEEDETIHQINNANNRNKNIGNHIHDIEKLKAQTNELLDPTWKDVRNRNLLHKMLELEEPMISPKVSSLALSYHIFLHVTRFSLDGRLPLTRWRV